MAASQAPGEGSGTGPLGCGRSYLPPVTASGEEEEEKPVFDRNEEWNWLLTDTDHPAPCHMVET